MNTGSFSYELVGIAQVLASYFMEVPANQRSYAWTSKEVKEYVGDIEKAMAIGGDFYYLGTVVLRKPGSHEFLQVVDGQQRLATTAIILGVIRDFVYASNDASTSKKLAAKYLKKEETWGPESVPRIRLNSLDNEFFLKNMLADPDDPERDSLPASKESHRRLSEARDLVKKHFESMTDSNRLTALKQWEGFLDTSVKTLLCLFGADTNPFTLFETLNGRGLSLSTAERVKNYLFGLSDDKLDSCMASWYEMVGSLEAADSDSTDELLDSFLRHYWIARTGRVIRTSALFPDVRAGVTSKAEAMKLSSELGKQAKVYHRILSPTEENWKEFDPACAAYMDAINTMGMVQVRPLILAMLGRFPKKEVKSSMRFLVDASIRLLVSRKAGRGMIESTYANLVARINGGAVSTASQLRAGLKSSVSDDAQFQKDFEEYSLSKKPLIRYVLRVLEQQMAGNGEAALVPNPSKDVVNIEHVLPLRGAANYPAFSADGAKLYINRIGNLALMQTKVNAKVGNSAFPVKRQFLAAEPFALTIAISKAADWTPAELDKRQAVLSKLASAAWSFK